MTLAVALVVDDHAAALDALAYALRDRYEVIVAATVREALAVLARLTPAVVVLDLLLDAPAAALHRELLLRDLPVVVVSGIEGDAAQAIARVWGVPALLKPVADHDLLTAVQRATRAPTTETHPMPDDNPQRATVAPPEPILPDARTPSDAPLHADPSVARADLVSRRALRGVCAMLIAGLTAWGDAHGHPVSAVTVVVIGALGMGINAAVEAAKKRPGATAAGGAGLAVLALGGTLLELPDAGSIAALGAAAVTALVDHARGA